MREANSEGEPGCRSFSMPLSQRLVSPPSHTFTTEPQVDACVCLLLLLLYLMLDR